MNRIAQLTRIRKRARVASLPHCVRVDGSADYFRQVVINKQNLRGQGGDGKIKGLSAHALSRLRDAIASTEHESGSYRVYGLCLTLPWGDKDGGDGSPTQADGAEIWRDWTHHLDRLLDKWHIGAIYRVELQKRRAVHWHLMLYLPVDIDFDNLHKAVITAFSKVKGGAWPIPSAKTRHGRPMLDVGDFDDDTSRSHSLLLHLLRISWINTLALWHDGAVSGRALARLSRGDALPPPLPIKSWDYCFNAICLDGVKSGLAYLASHTSKHKQEQLGYTGKQWGFLGRKWLREAEPVDLAAESQLSHDVRARAYRLIRRWARRNAQHTDWPAVRPRRVLLDDCEIYCGLVIRNTRTLYLFGATRNIVERAFECAGRV